MSAYLGTQPIKVLDKSKNLIPFPYLFTETTHNGVTYKVHADGSITLNGACTRLGEIRVQKNIPIKKGDKLTVNSNKQLEWYTVYIMLKIFNNGVFVKNYGFGAGETKTIEEECTSFDVSIVTNGDEGVVFDYFTIQFSVCAGEETELAPYNRLFRFRTGAMIRNPKNLIPFPYKQTNAEANGNIIKVQADGSIYAKTDGVATGYASITLSSESPFVVGKSYKISLYDQNGNTVTNTFLYVRYITADGATVYKSNTTNFDTFTWEKGMTLGGIFVQISPGQTFDGVFYPMLNEGESAEPYFVQD